MNIHYYMVLVILYIHIYIEIVISLLKMVSNSYSGVPKPCACELYPLENLKIFLMIPSLLIY